MAADLDDSVLSRLREMIGGAKVEQLVELFRENVTERQAAALRVFESGDQRELCVAFHSIKGSAQLVGARRLEAVAAGWEEKARSGEVESAVKALAEIAEAFAGVERALGSDGCIRAREAAGAGEASDDTADGG